MGLLVAWPPNAEFEIDVFFQFRDLQWYYLLWTIPRVGIA